LQKILLTLKTFDTFAEDFAQDFAEGFAPLQQVYAYGVAKSGFSDQ